LRVVGGKRFNHPGVGKSREPHLNVDRESLNVSNWLRTERRKFANRKLRNVR